MNALFEMLAGGSELSLERKSPRSVPKDVWLEQSNAPCHVVRLSRVPNSAAVWVEHWRRVDIALLKGCSVGQARLSEGTEDESSDGLREHHLES